MLPCLGTGATAPVGVLLILPAMVSEAASCCVPGSSVPGVGFPAPGADGAVRVPLRPRARGVETRSGLSLASLPPPGVGPVAHRRAVPRPVVRNVATALRVTIRRKTPAQVHVMGVIGVVAPSRGALPGVLPFTVRGPVAERLGRHVHAAPPPKLTVAAALGRGAVQAVGPIVVARRVGPAAVGKAPAKAAATALVGPCGKPKTVAPPHRVEPTVAPGERPAGALLIVGVALP